MIRRRNHVIAGLVPVISTLFRAALVRPRGCRASAVVCLSREFRSRLGQSNRQDRGKCLANIDHNCNCDDEHYSETSRGYHSSSLKACLDRLWFQPSPSLSLEQLQRGRHVELEHRLACQAHFVHIRKSLHRRHARLADAQASAQLARVGLWLDVHDRRVEGDVEAACARRVDQSDGALGLG